MHRHSFKITPVCSSIFHTVCSDPAPHKSCWERKLGRNKFAPPCPQFVCNCLQWRVRMWSCPEMQQDTPQHPPCETSQGCSNAQPAVQQGLAEPGEKDDESMTHPVCYPLFASGKRISPTQLFNALTVSSQPPPKKWAELKLLHRVQLWLVA